MKDMKLVTSLMFDLLYVVEASITPKYLGCLGIWVFGVLWLSLYSYVM